MVIKQKKRLLLIACAILICLCSIVSCEKKTQSVQPQESDFVIKANQIQTLCKSISTDLWENSKYLNTIYTSRELFLQTSQRRKYEISPELYLNIPREDDQGALFVTGFTTIKPFVLQEIDLTVPLDSIWKDTQDKHPEILQQYYIHKFSFIRTYPFIDLMSSYKPRQNLTKLEVFQVAQSRKEKDAKVIWFQPKWDPTFNEMVMNVAFPIRDGHDLIGALGCKVSLKHFLKDITGKNEPLTGIICRNGTLITADSSLFKNLGMAVPESISNPRQIAVNEDLRKSSNPGMRTLMRNLINSPYTNSVLKVGETSFYVECRLVPELNWVMFKMTER